MTEAGVSQNLLAQIYSIEQGSISRFLAGKTILSGDAVLELLPFVYGDVYAPDK